MKLVLKDFQVDAVEEFVASLRRAVDGVQRHSDTWAVSLASPTGSGKTVMMTAAVERVLEGDADYAPDENATFLWITDQPELNEQTRQRMMETSTVLGSSSLVVVDSSFEQPTLDPGTVYFLNTQKLSKNANLVNVGDARTITFWETIRNTVADRPDSFFVLIDEAHRGMQQSSKAKMDANSIVQKFILGSDGEIPPVPLITGISATPGRFNKLVSGSGRYAKPVEVSPEDVQSSGLLKEAIIVFHPTEDQPGDITMLRAAVREWQEYTERWTAYCIAQGEPLVVPVLTIQVDDAPSRGKKVSKTDLDKVMQAIEAEVDALPDEAFAHALQDKTTVTMSGREVRYLAPSEIQRDPDVRIVFFKSALTTGWDCPRAEVMMSFRTAKDETYIAQLVGRMVRTPLARRITADEHLNTVALFLPHFDEASLDKIIAYLSAGDPDTLPPVDVRKGSESLTLARRPGTEDLFDVLTELPSYVVPTKRKTSEIKRLMKLARRLSSFDEVHPDALTEAHDLLLGHLEDEFEKVKDTKEFKTFLNEDGKLDVAAVRYEFGQTGATHTEARSYDTAAANVDDLFSAIGRKLGEGLHKKWWKKRVAEDPKLKVQAKLELGALLSAKPEVLNDLKSKAQGQVEQWFKQFRKEINALDEGDRQKYDEIRGLANEPEETALVYPDAIEVKKEGDAWQHHLYADDSGLFTAKFNTWEQQVLEEEMRRDDFVAWLRNTDRKSWALCIPYQLGDDWKRQYPDFLVIRSVDSSYVVDLLEPHNISLKNSVEKANDLARYAKKHGDSFGRIELIIEQDGLLMRLDLNDHVVRDKAMRTKTEGALRNLFS
jgi:type III restriction enzyme